MTDTTNKRTAKTFACVYHLRRAVSIETYDRRGLVGKWVKIGQHWYQVIWRVTPKEATNGQ